jgi:polyhydroxybutyrate depolymerase
MYNINLDRIYATGMSNGGFMSFLLACQLSNKIAAIASVTGSMTTQTLNECDAQREVPILQIHGTNDPVVPYNGIQQWNTPIDDVLDYWVINNQCSPNPIVTDLEDINNGNGITVQEIIYNNGLNGSVVKHFKVNGGTHVWFQNEDIDSSALIWEFFSNYDINGLIN